MNYKIKIKVRHFKVLRFRLSKKSPKGGFFVIIDMVMKMLAKEKSERNFLEFVDIENLVPQNHILRKIDKAIDFTEIYPIVNELYCQDNGRPSIDPVVLFKIVLIQHIFGIPSLRRTLEEVNLNIAYRWFIGYSLNKPVPHFSTVSWNFKHS